MPCPKGAKLRIWFRFLDRCALTVRLAAICLLPPLRFERTSACIPISHQSAPLAKQASRKHEEHMTQQTQPLANLTLKSLHVGVVTSEPPPPKELIAQVLNAHLPWQIYSPKPYRFPPWDANRNVCLPPPLRSHTRAAPKNDNGLLLGLPNSTCICLQLYKIIPCAARKYVTQMAVPQAELNNWGRAS